MPKPPRLAGRSVRRTNDAPASTRALGARLLSVLAVSFGLSLFTIAYKRALDPLFGGTSTEKYLDHVVHACTVLVVVLPKISIGQALLILGLLVQFSPHSTYWVSVHAARYDDPIVGPLVTHVLVLAPVAFFSASLIMRLNVSRFCQILSSQDREAPSSYT